MRVIDMLKLTATGVKQAKPKTKAYKLWDGGSLYLLVHARGKYWRYDYRFLDKRKTLALGVYPDISLAEARRLHQLARKKLADGIDPNIHKQAERAVRQDAQANSFEVLALEWLQKRGVSSDSTKKRQNSLRKRN